MKLIFLIIFVEAVCNAEKEGPTHWPWFQKLLVKHSWPSAYLKHVLTNRICFETETCLELDRNRKTLDNWTEDKKQFSY